MKSYLPSVLVLNLGLLIGVSCKNTDKGAGYDTKSTGIANGISFQAEANRSAEYQDFAKKIRSVNSPELINQLLFELDEKYTKGELKTIEVKYFAAQMIPLRNFRSFVYKGKPLFQKDYSANGSVPATNATHHAAVTAVMGAVVGQRIMMPYTNASVVTDYITQPVLLDPRFDGQKTGEDAQVVKQYSNTTEMQKALICTRLRSDMETAALRIAELKFGKGNITVDAALALGQNMDAFSNSKHKQDRYALVGRPEQTATMAGLMAGLHNIYASCSYSIKDLSYAVEALGWTAGMDGVINRNEVSGAPASVRFNLLKRGKLPASMKSHVATRLALRSRQDRNVSQRIMTPGVLLPQGKQYMREALAHLKAAAHYGNAAYQMVLSGDYGSSDDMFPGRSFVKLDNAKRIADSFMARLRDVAGISESTPVGTDNLTPHTELVKKYLKTSARPPVAFRSLVDNTTTLVDVDKFYTSPPQNVRSLMPTGFADSGEKQFFTVAGGKSFGLSFGKKKKVAQGSGQSRNFQWGSATTWEPIWGEYFPQVGKHGVRGEIKILAESVGGAPIAAAMAPFIF